MNRTPKIYGSALAKTYLIFEKLTGECISWNTMISRFYHNKCFFCQPRGGGLVVSKLCDC